MHLQYIEQQAFLGNLKGNFWVSDRLPEGPSQLSVMLRPVLQGGAGGAGCDAACKKALPRKLSYWITSMVATGRVREMYVDHVLKRTCQLPNTCDDKGSLPSDLVIAGIEVIRQQLGVTADALPQFDVVDMLGVTVGFSALMLPVLGLNGKALLDSRKQRRRDKERLAKALQRMWRERQQRTRAAPTKPC